MLQLRANNHFERHSPLVPKVPLGDSGVLNRSQFTQVNVGSAEKRQRRAKPLDDWCNQLNRQLMYLMAWSRYAYKDVQRFSVFFDEIIRPALADARVACSQDAASSETKWLWPSFMTDSNDPVEVGMAWKGGSGPQVRFAIEAIGKGEITTQGTNLSAANELADALASIGLISYDVYADLQGTFAPEAKSHSQVFFGFDLNRGGTIDVKLYFVLGAESSLDRLAASLAGLDEKHSTSFEKSCKTFAQNIGSLPEAERGHGVIVAFDISGDLDQSRCKLYWRFPTFDIDTVAKRAAYQGGEAEQAAFQNLLSDCWENILDRPNKEDASLRSLTEHKTGGTLVYFDLCDGLRSKSKAKVYISVRHLFEGSTSTLAKRVEDFLIRRSPAVERGLADAIHQSSLSSSFSDSTSSQTSSQEEWMTYLCTEVDKAGRPGFCVYFRSCISA